METLAFPRRQLPSVSPSLNLPWKGQHAPRCLSHPPLQLSTTDSRLESPAVSTMTSALSQSRTDVASLHTDFTISPYSPVTWRPDLPHRTKKSTLLLFSAAHALHSKRLTVYLATQIPKRLSSVLTQFCGPS